jgi:hypothetical protein
MAVAAIQMQSREIAELRREVARLRAERPANHADRPHPRPAR